MLSSTRLNSKTGRILGKCDDFIFHFCDRSWGDTGGFKSKYRVLTYTISCPSIERFLSKVMHSVGNICETSSTRSCHIATFITWVCWEFTTLLWLGVFLAWQYTRTMSMPIHTCLWLWDQYSQNVNFVFCYENEEINGTALPALLIPTEVSKSTHISNVLHKYKSRATTLMT